MKTLTQVIMLITMGSLLLSCNADSLMGQITVDNIVNPDKVKPIISFQNGPASLTGDQDITVTFTVEDDPEGKGISEATLYYASDADSPVWKKVQDIEPGTQTLTFCVPNKTYDKPILKIEATDLNGNQAEETFIATTESASPIALASAADLNGLLPATITSDSNGLTNLTSTDISIPGTCKKTNCSATAIVLEEPTWDIYYAINVDTGTAPAAGDAAWTTCEDAITNGLTLPDLTAVTPGDGAKNVRLWVKAVDTDQDSSPIEERSTNFTDVVITYDATPPAVSIVDRAAAIQAGSTESVSYTATDATSAIVDVKLDWSEDNFATTTNLSTTTLPASPYSWTVPSGDHFVTFLRITATDAAGNSADATTAAFNIDATGPNVTLSNLPAVIRGGISNNISFTQSDINGIASLVLRYAADGTNFVDIVTDPSGSPYSWATPADNTSASRLQLYAIDNTGNETTIQNATFAVDSTPPTLAITDLAAKIQGGSNYNISFTSTDTNGVGSLSLDYSIDNGVSWTNISATPTSPYTWTLPGATDSTQSIIRLTGTDSVGNTTSVNSNTFEIDSTPPDHSTLNVLGSTFIKKARGEYVLTDCSDVAEVLITDDLESPPFLATDSRWQTCSDTTYSMTYDNIKEGVNNVRVWLKDSVENVNNSNWLSISTEYDPPNITVVDGPSITTSQASLTIDICEEVGMTDVLFNFTGTRPTAGDADWQTCSKAIGAFTSPVLSPGNNTLKAFFKYDDSFVSVFPIDVPVTYSPNLTWDQTPSTNKAALTFTGYTCTGISEVYFTNTATPAPDGTEGTGWQTCSTNAGAYTYELDGATVGDQAVYAFFKNSADSSIYNDYDTITVNYDPPTLSIFGGSNISTNIPDLSIDDCSGIDKVFIELNDGTPPSQPSVADFDNGALNNFACTTALNGLVLSSFPDAASLTLPSEGEHYYDVWLRYSADNYIAPHTMSRHRVVVNYLAEDSTPPL